MAALKTSMVRNVAGNGFWVEPDGNDTVKVGVIDNRDGKKVEGKIETLRNRLRNAKFRTRVTGNGAFRLLRVW
jgi:hypothetical protein